MSPLASLAPLALLTQHGKLYTVRTPLEAAMAKASKAAELSGVRSGPV